ncbi:MAG: taurine catabolism dioxygenase TauD, partial [Gammaproteobacteria bacterium]|nr:taurine catabolism dioxygenase TauD [Gammaproteobacteria bacterium]
MRPARDKGYSPIATPFDLTQEASYRRWREEKLANYPTAAAQIMVDIADPYGVTPAEQDELLRQIRRCNMAIYRIDPAVSEKSLVAELGRQFGLERLDSNLCADADSITSLTVIPGGRQKGYIPYSNRQLNWHTDGYYNAD